MAFSSNLHAISKSPHLILDVYSPRYTEEGRKDCPVVTVLFHMGTRIALISNKCPKALPCQPLEIQGSRKVKYPVKVLTYPG